MGDTTLLTYQEHEKRVAAMLDDPDLTGDLLLIGIALARHLDFGGGEGDEELTRIAATVFPGAPGMVQNRIVVALRNDIRRYQIPGTGPGTRNACQAPMVTRDHCGKPASSGAAVTDVETGEMRMLGACGQRDHRDWWREELKAAKAAKEAAGDTIPRPCANAGGVLARYFPNVDWPNMWRHLDSTWEPYPEAPEHVTRLRLVPPDLPDVVINGETVDLPRPVLRVIR